MTATAHTRTEIGILLIHGFTASPELLKAAADELRQEGYSVHVPRLAGHGTNTEDLEKTTWHDWYDSVESDYRALHKTCATIIVVGFSLGGNLAIQLATKHSINGLVLIGTPRWLYRHTFVSYMMIPFYKLFGRRNYNTRRKVDPTDEIALYMDMFSYSIIPVKSAQEAVSLINRTTATLVNKVHVPTLILQPTKDRIVRSKSGAFFYRHIGSDQKELIWLEGPHHVIQKKGDEKKIYSYIHDFIQKYVTQSTNKGLS
jgi:carboxylesterase